MKPGAEMDPFSTSFNVYGMKDLTPHTRTAVATRTLALPWTSLTPCFKVKEWFLQCNNCNKSINAVVNIGGCMKQAHAVVI